MNQTPGRVSLLEELEQAPSLLVISVCGWLAATLEVFSRYHFGARYLTVARLVWGAWALVIYSVILGGFDVAGFLAWRTAGIRASFGQVLGAAPGNALVL